MFLDEIFRPKTGDEVLMSADDMRQARINRYGTDDITPLAAQDYSDKFNTELTPEEEAEFQSWAKENNRERDSYDYDIRGAWKELKSGSMSEDERGHLGDKYKKPNHPTFSDQSVYNGKDGVAGGTWSEVDGKTVFTPGRMLSKREAEYLSDYFKLVEPDVKLNLDGKIIKPKPLPGTGYEPGLFEGWRGTRLGMNAALAETKSAALTALSELPIGTEQEREGWLRAAEATRAYSKAHYEADPELMGSASQIIHGLFKTIPKAAGYMAALGPGAGAVAFGADMGISESQRLKDEGVDQATRTSAGVMSFAANAIGLRLPGAFGSTRLMSTLYGAGANIGTDVAERKGIQLILENQNYGELAKQYEISGTDLAVSGIFGGAFGALGYRSPQARFESEVAERRESLKKDLMKAGYSEEEADVQAGMHARGEILFAKQAGVDWKDVGYTVQWSDGTSATAGSYNQIVGQKGAYHLGWDVYSGMWTAEQMRSEGKTPEQIRLATGWEVGADGKWRFEIPDMKLKDDIYADLDKLDKEVKAELDEQLMSKEGAEYEAAEADVRKRRSNAVVKKTLGDIVDAPELFEAYPKLRYMTVEFGPLDRGVGAYYDPHEKLIRLSNEKPLLGLKDKDGIGVLVHEVQHAVQDIEGFTSGASPSAFPRAGEALAKDMSRLFELKRSSENYKKYREAAQAFEKSVESGEGIDESMRAFDAARELLGNAEIFAEEQRLTDKWGMDADIQAAIRNASDDADPLFQKISKNDIGYQQRQYHRVAGEVEARNVTRRLGMSEDERRASTLESTEDVDRSEQQTRHGRPVRSESREIKDPLITVHNISADNLLKVDSLGGLAVPSLGVTKAKHAYSDFGDITLIGTRKMVDPAGGTPIWSMDAYTNRFPAADWSNSVDKVNAKKLSSEVAGWEKKYGDDDHSMYYLFNEPDRDKFASKFANSVLTKQAFLETKGVKVEPIYYEQTGNRLLMAELKDGFNAIIDSGDFSNLEKRYSEVYADAVDRLGERATTVEKNRAKRIKGGKYLTLNFIDMLRGRIAELDKPVERKVNKAAVEEKVDAELKPHQAEYENWVGSKIAGIFGAPGVRVGNKVLPMTLENVVRAMTMRNARNAETTFTFGPGKVRAASAKKFRSIEDVQKARDRIVDSEQANGANKEIDKRMSGFASSMAEYFGSDSLHAFDAAMEILADCASGAITKAKLKSMAESRGFKNVPDDVIDEGVSILKEVKKGLTDYFEAKPQRAVKLNEFVGAVVPEGTSPEVMSVLEKNGLSVKTYPENDRAGRQGAIESLSTDLDGSAEGGVFYQAAYHGTAYTFDKFTLDHVGSGEGVQAHGWGLYFSLDRQIAEGYRSRVTSYRAVADELSRVFAGMDIKTREGMAKALASAGDKLSPATRELLEALQEANWLGHENPMDAVQASLVAQIGKGKQTPRIKSAVEGLRNEDGNVYKVEIPDDDVMMHEELPLSQQPEAVQKAVHALLTDEDVRTQPDMRREKNGIEDVEPVSYAGKSLDEMTGKEILAALIAKYGSAKAASLALKEHGLKGYRYKGAIDGECAVVFDDAAIEMRNAIEKAKADGTGVVKLPDGRFEVKGSYDPKKRKITLTLKADISTFAHEHSHWYLDMLMKVLGKEDIDPDLREAAEALLRSWGIKSVEDWNALGVEGQRKYQEQFAAWTESYLSKGKSPVKGLEGLFERFGEWIVDLYKKALGLDPDSAVKDRYKSETGEDLPPLSKEMEAVIRRMYGEQQKAKSVKPTPSQVTAARMAQAQRMNERKLTAPMANPNDPEAMDVAIKAQRQAAEQLNNGQAVDVGATLHGVQMNDVALTNSQKHFARAVQMGGDNSSLVVLQNRDRSKLAPVAQMNAIAANPQYGRVSFSRTTDTGAPIVSFGSMPDERYQGITDWVMDGGEKIPVTYAVVEADSVLTSNDWSGRAVDGYGDDPTRVHAVAGNGRLAGLNEAFERGTATQYVADMMADRQQTGINPEAIGNLKRPVLVRFMPSEKVTTGFIDRSNQSAVLELSGSERAVQDAAKLTTDKLKAYQFDENGEPTRATLDRFVNDIGEPSAIGGLIDGDGKPTEAAKARVMAAVFYKAYRDPELTSLMSVETDKQGMKRVLNAMAAFAPHVIRIREMSGGAIDLGPAIVDAAHMLKSGEVPMDGALIDDVGPASRQMFELLYNNRKSAAAIGRVFNGFSDEITSSLGEGTGMLIGDPLDLADAMGFLRRAQNAEIKRQMDEGKTGLALMPDVDIVAVREALKAAEEAKRSAENLVSAMGEKVIQDAESKQNGGAEDVQAKAEQEEAARLEEARARSLEVVGKSADMVRLENLAAEKPNQTYVLDDSGVQMTMEDVVKEMQRIEQEADIEAAGIGKAAECILRNGGIQQ